MPQFYTYSNLGRALDWHPQQALCVTETTAQQPIRALSGGRLSQSLDDVVDHIFD